MEQKIKLILEYDGTAYCGWQRQLYQPTVQETIEVALGKIYNQKVVIVGASRTDTGVHALRQVAHFVPPQSLQQINYVKAINSNLPSDVRILEATSESIDFDANRSAISKIYEYKILNKKKPSAIHRNFSWWLPIPLDIASMYKASNHLIGRHDFKVFCASDSHIKTTVREVFEVHWYEREEFLIFMIHGSGFLKQMVRSIVGSVVEVGRHKWSISNFETVLHSKDRSLAGPTAPARGLYLKDVFYS
ncbi:MAG: tRNA pseudouridine(38-40) synthase TruA [Deltaproteobacteria bacterium]|nr:tRNA pseudouridine(38-40) synthase TruA [Deltaproteobacteria bacterium]